MNPTDFDIKSIRAYRAPHRIDPVPAYVAGIVDPELVCDFCGLLIYRIKGGYRHDEAAVARMDRPSSWPSGVA